MPSTSGSGCDSRWVESPIFGSLVVDFRMMNAANIFAVYLIVSHSFEPVLAHLFVVVWRQRIDDCEEIDHRLIFA